MGPGSWICPELSLKALFRTLCHKNSKMRDKNPLILLYVKAYLDICPTTHLFPFLGVRIFRNDNRIRHRDAQSVQKLTSELVAIYQCELAPVNDDFFADVEIDYVVVVVRRAIASVVLDPLPVDEAA